ncbi:MAG: hypothetical protein AMJ69_10125 [Gammaproteobacteria bacterium SG8_47]|nr:MAG: hypothetical protein AMJ69_10125 [Gammaproteobacteria bacterium SG8_47]
MKLEIRMVFRDDVERKLRRDKQIAQSFDIDNAGSEWYDSRADFLDAVFAATRDTSGIRVYVDVSLNTHETMSVQYFEVAARKLLKVSDKVQRKNDAYMASLAPMRTSAHSRITVRDKILLKHIKLKGSEIGSMEFGEGYVCSKDLSQLFVNAGFTGYVQFPVCDAETEQVRDDHVLIGAGNILPPLEPDETILPAEYATSDDLYYRRQGLTSYAGEAMRTFCDFNLTAESYREDDNGLLVVSKAVRQLCIEHKIRGIGFTPILTRPSELYTTYLDRFAILREKLNVNPANKLL